MPSLAEDGAECSHHDDNFDSQTVLSYLNVRTYLDGHAARGSRTTGASTMIAVFAHEESVRFISDVAAGDDERSVPYEIASGGRDLRARQDGPNYIGP